MTLGFRVELGRFAIMIYTTAGNRSQSRMLLSCSWVPGFRKTIWNSCYHVTTPAMMPGVSLDRYNMSHSLNSLRGVL